MYRSKNTIWITVSLDHSEGVYWIDEPPFVRLDFFVTHVLNEYIWGQGPIGVNKVRINEKK